jgi:hypothetical protein
MGAKGQVLTFRPQQDKKGDFDFGLFPPKGTCTSALIPTHARPALVPSLLCVQLLPSKNETALGERASLTTARVVF